MQRAPGRRVGDLHRDVRPVEALDRIRCSAPSVWPQAACDPQPVDGVDREVRRPAPSACRSLVRAHEESAPEGRVSHEIDDLLRSRGIAGPGALPHLVGQELERRLCRDGIAQIGQARLARFGQHRAHELRMVLVREVLVRDVRTVRLTQPSRHDIEPAPVVGQLGRHLFVQPRDGSPGHPRRSARGASRAQPSVRTSRGAR